MVLCTPGPNDVDVSHVSCQCCPLSTSVSVVWCLLALVLLVGCFWLVPVCLWGRILHRCRRQPEDLPGYVRYPCSGEFRRLPPCFVGYVDVLGLRFALPEASPCQTASCCGSGKQGGKDVAASQLPSVAAAELGDGPPRFSGMIWSLLVCDCRVKSIVRMPRQILGLRIDVRAVTSAHAP